MPSDIRAFFGGNGTTVSKPAPPPAKQETRKRGRAKKIVSDDEDDEPALKKATPKKASPRKEAEIVHEETTADDYFGKGSKPKRSEVTRSKVNDNLTLEGTPQKSAVKTRAANGSARKTRAAKKESITLDSRDFPDDDLEDNEDNFKSEAQVGRAIGDDYVEGTDEEEDDIPAKSRNKGGRPNSTAKQAKTRNRDDDDFEAGNDIDVKNVGGDDDGFVVTDVDEKAVRSKPAKKSTAATRKRKSSVMNDDDDLEKEDKKSSKKSSPTKMATPAKKQKKEEAKESAQIKAIFDNIPTIEPPPPPPKSGDGGKPKFPFGGAHANSAVPAGAISSSDLPQGEDNCLAGLSFVFTGQLQSLGREQGQQLVKRYGGRVMGTPSRKTSYVVLGEEAGPKKLQTIQDLSLKVINETGLFELIRRLPANGGDSAAAEKQAEKHAKEEENIRKAAAEMEKQERARLAAAKPKPNATGSTPVDQSKGKTSTLGPDTRLWTVRYAPQSLGQICGNTTAVQKLQRWLRNFPNAARKGFKLGGPDGSGVHRAVMIHGPPGIGKTSAAHLVAKLEGYDVVESNASDTRSKKLVETGLKGVLDTRSLMGYFAPGADTVEAGKKKLVMIMDEVDGMSAGDRGGVGALAAVCKKTQIPMILICNDRKLPKMAPFNFCTYDLPFRRPTTDQIRSRIMTIAFREGLKIPPNVINALIEGSGADIRQVVNMISTAKLDSETMSFEEGKGMSKAWEKHIVLKPWDMVGKILGGGLFNPAANSTLNDKQELYFNDHEFAPLMLQENYLNTNPARANKFADPKKRKLAQLELVSQAADSISDGDLVDRMIHGSQQQWSLMPTHAMFSFVRPASFIYGSMAGSQTRFTAWLGKNSNQGKLMRVVKEIQGHMRLRISGDRFEVRQSYMPLLFDRLVRRLQKDGKDVVPDIIETMDEYYLTREDWDSIMELGVGENDMETVKIESSAKAAFTRIYNLQSHPLPFMKASQVVAPKRAPARERPDLEEAFEESADEASADDADVKAEDEEVDVTKDKYVKQPKKKRAPAASKKGAADGGTASSKAKGKAKGKGKKAADDEDEEMDDFVDDEEEDEKPKKKGKGKSKK
ncbi:DNA replication factor C, large subunit [Polychaeton citri CBS 116435]|uniref:Replication factor C subunit 1 n=1 Tax=Polychaeton citri CBS 116435 TaxID=1314669 RepID=A0A9P4QD89_9PEZI|nr:DNA replication factor C, large subunit [Polychaeton citri CBS 116435]